MHERSKLAEARHFLDRMYAERGNVAVLTQELSAFMAAARSVLQYTLKEAHTKQGGQSWYEAAVRDPLIRYFKDKRDVSIHASPVSPVRRMRTESAGLLNIGDEEDEIMIPYPHTRTVEYYEFSDRPGEELVDLSQRYLARLEALVEDGVAAGWITGRTGLGE